MAVDRYDKAILYIADHWREGLTLKDVSARFNLDPGNLDRKFRQARGTTVSAYVRTQRRAYMLERLRGGGVYGYQIGTELGFGNDWSFYRWVKRTFGVSFAELKKKRGETSTTSGVDSYRKSGQPPDGRKGSAQK